MSDVENHTLALLRELREDLQRNTRLTEQGARITVATHDKLQRLERRLDEVRTDLENTIKIEIMGAGLDWRRSLESRMDDIEAALQSA